MNRSTLSITAVFAMTLAFSPSQAADTPNPAASTAPSPFGLPISTPTPSGHSFSVRDYGAKGDGATKDTSAFQKALDACAATGGEVNVPAGNYILGSVTLGSNTTLRLEKDAIVTESPDLADYPKVQARFEGQMVDSYRSLFSMDKADHVAILGPGAIHATTSLCATAGRTPRPPLVIETMNCNDVLLDGFSLQYGLPSAGQRAQIWCIHPCFSTKVVIRNLTIRSQLTYGDGMDIDSCNNVLVEKCNIDSGEDGVGFKSGKGLDAELMHKPDDGVIIRDSIITGADSAIAVGSELSGGLLNITLSNCTLSGKNNAIYIKSRDDRGGIVENFNGDNLTIVSSRYFLTINLATQGVSASNPVPGGVAKWTVLRNISFKNVKVSGVSALVTTRGVNAIPTDQPMQNFMLENITGSSQSGITLQNVVNANFSNITLTGISGKLFNLTNVTGKGLVEPPAAQPVP